jgi:glycosyltransferase involved in cell wall biosynthesis
MRVPDRKPAHVLFLGNSTLYFISHRISLARALAARGFSVSSVLPAPVSDEHRNTIAAAGIAIHEYPYKPTGMNPLVEVRSIIALRRLYRDLKPDVVHHLTLKPSLYGGAVSRWLGTETRIQSIMGLGYLFNATDLLPRVLRTVLSPVFRYAFGGRGSIITLQNADDLGRLAAVGAIRAGQWPRVEIIPGSGVDPDDYDPAAKPEEPPIVLFAGRLTKSKGVVEFAEAARLLRSRYAAARFVLCGAIVDGHPAAVSETDVRAWVDDGAIEWWGYRDDMPAIMTRSRIVVLPSHHGEGLPRALLEAAAAARAIITTDTEGCREIGRHGVNGLLVPVGDAHALRDAVSRLLGDPSETARMGKEGRRIVEAEFSLHIVINKMLELYDTMLSDREVTAPKVDFGITKQTSMPR